jgi:hypothetical protein
MKQFNWKYLVLIVLAILLLKPISNYLGKTAAQHANERESSNSPPHIVNNEIRIVVSSQDAAGVTQQNFDISFLKNLEAYTVERVKLKAKEYLVSQGHPNAPLDIVSEATYVTSGTTKLAVIRLRGADGSNNVFIAGIINNELKRVACVRNSLETIPITYGVCGEKIKEVFGSMIGE